MTGAPANLPVVDVRRLAREERADFAAFLATLSPQQWQAPTLCAAWRVRDVVAHVISYDDLGPRDLLMLAARGRFRPAASTPPRWRATTAQPGGAAGAAGSSPAAPGGPRGAGRPGRPGRGVIHHQDVRRELARPRRSSRPNGC